MGAGETGKGTRRRGEPRKTPGRRGTCTLGMGMPLGVGVDILSIGRMRDILESSGSVFVDKVFTPYERERYGAHHDGVAYLAMTFAAKEAVFKTFGIGWETGVQFKEIEVRDGKWGEPLVFLSGRFLELAAEREASGVLLSLSYDGDYAIAMAVLSGGRPEGKRAPQTRRRGNE